MTAYHILASANRRDVYLLDMLLKTSSPVTVEPIRATKAVVNKNEILLQLNIFAVLFYFK